MTRAAWQIVFFMCIVAQTAVAAAPESGAPVRLTLGPNDFGQLPETHAADRILVTQRGALLIDEPDFFGTITLDTQIRASIAFAPLWWIDLSLALLEYRQIINASVVANVVSFGPVTASLHREIALCDRLTLAPYARLLLPTESAMQFAQQMGVEAGLSASYALRPMVGLVGGLTLPGTFSFLGGRRLASFRPSVVLDVGVHPWAWSELVLGAEARFGTDAASRLEYIAPHAALRFYPYRGLVVEVKALYNLKGVERTDLAGGLSAGWVFGRPRPASPPAEDEPAGPEPASLPAKDAASAPASNLSAAHD